MQSRQNNIHVKSVFIITIYNFLLNTGNITFSLCQVFGLEIGLGKRLSVQIKPLYFISVIVYKAAASIIFMMKQETH